MKTCWEEGNQMCQQQDMRTQVADPAPVPFSPRGRRARDEGANFTAEIDDFDQGYCTDNCGQTRYRQPSIFGKFDTDQPQWLLPHPRPHAFNGGLAPAAAEEKLINVSGIS